MADEMKKTYSAKEAALAVLKKTQELMEKSEAFKKPTPTEAPKEQTVSEPVNPKQQIQETQATGKQQTAGNNEWGTAPEIPGHIKLAHFIGHISAKRSVQQTPAVVSQIDKAETGHEKGVHVSLNENKPGQSFAGKQSAMSTEKGPIMNVAATTAHKQVLSEIKAQPKPNLTRSETLEKAIVDEGKTPQQKATDRVNRGNTRYHLDSHQKHAEYIDSSYKPGHTPHPGTKGQKVIGIPPTKFGNMNPDGDHSHSTHTENMEAIRSLKPNLPGKKI